VILLVDLFAQNYRSAMSVQTVLLTGPIRVPAVRPPAVFKDTLIGLPALC